MDEFTKEERQLLGEWTPDSPPADFAERAVLAANEPPKRQRRWWLLAVSAAAVLAVLLWPARGEQTGSLSATARVTEVIADRGTAVAEAGTELTWRVAPGGAARVVQKTGSAFYRVEPGESFVVETALGEVRVLGTCFRVEVVEMKAGRAAITGAAMGAALTAAVLVTVYEGKVEAASNDQPPTQVDAGHTATMREGAPTVLDEAPTPEAAPPEVATPTVIQKTAPLAPAVSGPAAPAGECERSLTAAKDEAAALDAKMKRMAGDLARAKKAAEQTRTYDLSPERLDEMAKECQLAWDHPGIRLEGVGDMPDEVVKELGLTPEQHTAIVETIAESNTRLLNEMRAAYAAVNGIEADPNVAPQALFAEIQDKTEHRTLRRIFQALSAERAGHQDAPQTLDGLDPVERLFRVVTTAGDRLQGKLADRVGEDVAQRLRDLKNGFGNRSRSSYGCPKITP